VHFITDNKRLTVVAVIASILLTIGAIALDPIINNDGVLYLTVAEELALGNFYNAFTLYKWPFFSGLITITHSLTGLSLLYSAYFLNIVFHTLSVIGFLACVHALGANKRTLVIAAILILLFPSMNKYRAFIIRDAGFLALYLWTIYHLIQGITHQRISHLIWATITILFASLFRIEAIAPLFILPLHMQYLRSRGRKRKAWLVATIISSITVFLGMSIWLFGEHASRIQPGIWGFLSESLDYAVNSLQTRVKIIAHSVLNPLSKEFAASILWLTVTLIILYEPLRRLYFFFAYFSWHAVKNKLVLQQNSLRKVFYAMCCIQLGLMAIFTAINMYLVSRHTMALVLTILILTPFSISYFYEKWFITKDQPKWVGVSILSLLLLAGVEGLNVKTKRMGIKEQGDWLKQNIDSKSSVYSNNALLLHYAGRKPGYLNLRYDWPETNDLLVKQKIFDFDFVVISIEKDNRRGYTYINSKINKKPKLDQTFSDGNRILVYDLRNDSPASGLASKYFKIKDKRVY